MRAHDSLFLLFLLRSNSTSACAPVVIYMIYMFIDGPVLSLTTQSFVSLCMQRPMSIWMALDGAQHLCPSGRGCLAVRGVVFPALSAYLASAASTVTEITSILCFMFDIDAALAAWTRLAVDPIEMSIAPVTPSPLVSTAQPGTNIVVK